MKEKLNYIYNLGITPELSAEDRRRSVLVNQVIFFCSLPCILMLPIVWTVSELVNVLFIATSGLLLSCGLLFSRKGNFRGAIIYFIIVASINIALGALMFRNSSTDLYLIPAATIPFITLKCKRTALWIFGCEMLLFIFINISYPYIEPINSFEGVREHIAFVNSVVIISGMILVILYKLKQQNDIYEEDIIKQKELIEEVHKEITDSINYAKRIQEAIMPNIDAMHAALGESFVLYEPKDVVAGDFFWMEAPAGQAGNDDVVYYAAADCTGHGVPGAMVSVVCSNALTKALLEEGIRDTGKLLDRTRELVITQLAKSGEEVKDGMDISLCRLNQKSENGNQNVELQWSGANNPLWILRKGAAEFEEIKADKQPIGKYEDPKPFTSHNIELKEGDTIYIFTDGYQDQFGGPKGKKFKAKQLKQILLDNQQIRLAEQKELLLTKLRAWQGDQEQVDDVCIIGVKI